MGVEQDRETFNTQLNAFVVLWFFPWVTPSRTIPKMMCSVKTNYSTLMVFRFPLLTLGSVNSIHP
jgi:hypothetical protein